MKDRVTEVVEKISDLSGLPQVTEEVIRVIGEENSCAADLEKVLRFDPSLVARVIRVANSAYYVQSSQINTIRNAVILLGFDTIKNIAMAVSIAELFKGDFEVQGYSREGLWRHMVTVATAARMIARRTTYPDPEEAFLAGMMHDLGLILLDQYVHDDFVTVIETAMAEQRPLVEVERQIMDIDHAFLGARIARKWNFPRTIRHAMAYHHDPHRGGEENKQLVMIVHLSDLLSRMHEAFPSGECGKASLDRSVFTVLDIQPVDIKVINADLKEELTTVKDFFDLKHGA